MERFVFDIFPIGSLDSSVATTIWIGLVVVCFFNLRFGWVLSGLVVPGYLVPIMLIKPWSAVVIVAEAIITYLAVWFCFKILTRWSLWFTVFGRDRFFAILLGSIIIRLILDGCLLPIFGVFLSQRGFKWLLIGRVSLVGSIYLSTNSNYLLLDTFLISSFSIVVSFNKITI